MRLEPISPEIQIWLSGRSDSKRRQALGHFAIALKRQFKHADI